MAAPSQPLGTGTTGEPSQPPPAAGSKLLGRVATCLLIVWIAADVGLRFAPLDWLNVLPQLLAARTPSRSSPFRANFSGVQDPWIGESALTANLPPTETRPPVRFSTDGLGYRLTPGCLPGSPVQAIVFGGKSMAYGGSLSDEETLSAVLTNTHGVPTYNAGRFFWDVNLLSGLDYVLDGLGRPRATLIELYWEDFDPSIAHLNRSAWRVDSAGISLLGEARYNALRNEIQFARRNWAAWWSLGPAEVLSTRLIKRISNDRVLPNPYKAGVDVRLLPNGDRIVLLKEEVDRGLQPPDDRLLRRNADYYSRLQVWAREHGLDLRMVLIPNRYSVYGPLTENYTAAAGPHYLQRLESELTRRGIRTLNLLDLYRSSARADVAARSYSFYREDHHWSPLGVRRAAEAIAANLRAALPAKESTGAF
jgi:hypothetical protein